MAARVWKDGTRRGIAYVENRETAERVMALLYPGQPLLYAGTRASAAKTPLLPPGTMAVYSDKKGKPFAWQIAFTLSHWDTVSSLLGTTGEAGVLP